MRKEVQALVDEGYIKMKGGKEYLQVAHRIVWFRDKHPDWLIDTQPVEINERTYMKCTISRPTTTAMCSSDTPKPENVERILTPVVVAHKEVKWSAGSGASKDYPLETAETGAVGRALGFLGHGTLAGDLDEGDQLADAPQELSGAIAKRK